MPNNAYRFVTHWRVRGTCEEVADVSVLEPGDPHGLGQRVNLFTKGWLPYTLRWKFTVVEERRAIPPPPGPTFVRKRYSVSTGSSDGFSSMK